jgi:glycosyltransferase involved in cell wall biosynthesis
VGSRRMRILAFAYACAPQEGSEPGVGWTWSRMLAKLGDTWVITRANNKEAIEAALEDLPNAGNLNFAYVDLPAWARFWKRGLKGLRPYYLLWQLQALLTARRLHRDIRFDLVWHVTIANAWLGSAAPLVGPPFVYGPVGGGVKIPPLLLGALGLRGVLYEVARSAARGACRYLNPLARVAWRRATLILVQNEETRCWFPKNYQAKAEIFPNAVLEKAIGTSRRRTRPHEMTAVFAGRLLPWKGVSLAVRSLSVLPGWRLLICGSGPDEDRIRWIIARRALQERAHLIGRLSRDRLHELMETEADVFLFPSMHDDGPWAVAEAVSLGLPVVCLAIGGPPVLGARGVQVSTPRRTVEALAREVLRVSAEEREPQRVFDFQSRLDRLAEVLSKNGILPRAQVESS